MEQKLSPGKSPVTRKNSPDKKQTPAKRGTKSPKKDQPQVAEISPAFLMKLRNMTVTGPKIKSLRGVPVEPKDAMTVVQLNQSGWQCQRSLLNFLKYIKKVFWSNDTGKKLILLDSASSHHTSMIIKWCNDNNIIVLQIPKLATCLVQPCDAGIFGPFKITLWQLASSYSKKLDAIGQMEILSQTFDSLNKRHLVRSAWATTGVTVSKDKVTVDGTSILDNLGNETEDSEELINVDEDDQETSTTTTNRTKGKKIIHPLSICPRCYKKDEMAYCIDDGNRALVLGALPSDISKMLFPNFAKIVKQRMNMTLNKPVNMAHFGKIADQAKAEYESKRKQIQDQKEQKTQAKNQTTLEKTKGQYQACKAELDEAKRKIKAQQKTIDTQSKLIDKLKAQVQRLIDKPKKASVRKAISKSSRKPTKSSKGTKPTKRKAAYKK